MMATILVCSLMLVARTVPVPVTTDSTVSSPAVVAGTSVKGRQVRIIVRGDRFGKKAKVTLRGYRGRAQGKKRTVRVRKRMTVGSLKPGRYRIAASRITKRGSVAKVSGVNPRRVRVTRRHGARSEITYRRERDRRNAIAYASLSDPSRITVVGVVPRSRAWSTSKVLVVAAFLDTVAGGDPDRLTSYWRRQIKAALTASNLNALRQLRGAIPGGSGKPMTRILRSIGDSRTTAPDVSEGSMQWSVRNQVRFMAALHSGKIVSKRASRYVLGSMRPIVAHRWGLGTIGASAFKGGWLYPNTETRQMGIVGDYAVAIITAGVGPAELQTDGDWAHVGQMNKLAKRLKRQLDAA